MCFSRRKNTPQAGHSGPRCSCRGYATIEYICKQGCHFAEIIKGDGYFIVSGHNCPTHTGSRNVVSGCPLHHYFPRDDEIIAFDGRVQRQATPNRRARGWDESNSNTSSEAPPENNIPLFSQSPPPSPTESQYGWPNRPSARESSSLNFDDLNIEIDDFNPEDYVDFDYDRPPLCLPGWFKPSDDLQPTHWYDVAAARNAEAWAAVELDAALERVTETAAILATARATAEEADLHVYNATLQITVGERSMCSPEYFSTLHVALDVATGQARDAAEAVAVAAAEDARARAAARIAGASFDDDSDNDSDMETDDIFDNGLPWSSRGSWSIVNQLDVLGETQGDYEEH